MQASRLLFQRQARGLHHKLRHYRSADEQVSWSHRITVFEHPPKDDLKNIEETAKDAKIKLSR